MCSKPAHLACMLRRFKESGNDHHRNSVDWLMDFLEFSFLHYVSSQYSKINCGKGNVSSQELSIMKQSINELDRKMANILKVVQISVDVTPGASKGTEASSYSQALSKNQSDVIVKTVKRTVAKSIKTQRKTDADRASIALYGLPEGGDDGKKVLSILASIGCQKSQSLFLHRIGKDSGNDSSKSNRRRPFKVQLSSDVECQQVLVNTKHLKEDPSLAGISIAKWLSRAEVDKVKHLRKQCSDLNKNCPPDVSGRKPYVVISGRLMKRIEDGKMQRVSPTIPTNTSIAFLFLSAGNKKTR